MNKILAVVAALLLIQLVELVETSVATAAENPEHLTKRADVSLKQKKAEKFLMMMKTIGISDPNLTALVRMVDSNTKNGYLTLHQEEIAGGTLSFTYKLEPKVGVKHLELLYVPKDSHIEYRARTNSMMVNYKLKF